MCEVGFSKADSTNLPEVDLFMVMEYFNSNHNFISAEMRGVKMQRSARQSYGDNAIGYVEVKRDKNIYCIRAKITPEHKINKKNYKVTCNVNANNSKIDDVTCLDCPASEGGCKHAIALLMWLHRRSEEPSPTETICYWKKSVLAIAGTTKKFITVADFGKKKIELLEDNSSVNEYINEGKKRKIENSTLRYHQTHKYISASLFSLKREYNDTNPDNFIKFCKAKMNESLLKDVEEKTKDQSKSNIWFELRYGRVTASKAYEATKCLTLEGSLVENILGAKVFQTEAMKRGLRLEEQVLKILSEKTSKKFKKSGLFLSSECPIVGASPDAINDEFVVEIKSPQSDKTLKNYISDEGTINLKYFYQIQMQMHLSRRPKALFVVAKPSFETSKGIIVKSYDYDNLFAENMLNEIRQFWVKTIFNKL